MPKRETESLTEIEELLAQHNRTKTIKEREFARLVGLSLANLQRLRKRGEVAHLRVGRRILYLVPEHLEMFIKRYNQPGTVVRS
jgi:DNA-binding Xre family transcriptional regulator